MRRLEPELEERVLDCLDGLIPPSNEDEADTLGLAGEPAVAALRRREGYTCEQAALLVRALGRIGGEVALEAIAGYATRFGGALQEALAKQWTRFEANAYAGRVLASALRDGCLHLGESAGGTDAGPEQIAALAGIEGLTSLELRGLRGVRGEDLAHLPQGLTSLVLVDLPKVCGGDLAALQRLAGLRKLGFLEQTSVRDLSALVPMAGQLEEVALMGMPLALVVPVELRSKVKRF